MNWALARQRGWRVLLRIEDLDGPRIKADAARRAIETLAWLGLDWDVGPVYQTHDLAPYRAALERLRDQGDVYPCRCTRSQILAAARSAPHAGDRELRYSNTCRPDTHQPDTHQSNTVTHNAASPDTGIFDAAASVSLDDPKCAWRLVTPDEPVAFEDSFAGSQRFWPQREVGDFLVATKGGQPSYQLAVVVDDARQGVTHVVRGDDLLPSTPRQLLLYARLGLSSADGVGPPEYTHLPIVVGEDGRRLAKRHGDTRVDAYRAAGVTAERVVGLLAAWCGVGPDEGDGPTAAEPMTAAEFGQRFDLAKMPRERVTFTTVDDAWLRGGTI